MPPPAEGFAARLVLGPALRTQPDRRLVTLVREGYETAFEEIVRRYGKPLTRYAAAIVGSRGEDVTQEAFSKALLALRRDNSAEIELRPWLFRIVRNTALNDLRDSPPSPELLAEAIAGGSNPAEEMERREELADLMHRLRSLPDRQRAAIVMRELEGLSHEEIAAALGLSGGAARQAIFRARQALRDGLGMLLPLPLLRLLIDHGGEMAAAGASASGAAAASGAVGGAGAGLVLKAGVVTAVLAGSVGTGIALHDREHGDTEATAAATSAASPKASSTSAPAPAAAVPTSSTTGTSGEDDDLDGRGDSKHSGRGSADNGDQTSSQPLGPDNNRGQSSGPQTPEIDRHNQQGPGDDARHGGRGPGSATDGRGDHHGGDESHSGSGSGGEVRPVHVRGADDGGGSGPGRGHSESESGRHGSGHDGSDDDSPSELTPPPPAPEEEGPREDEGGSNSGSGGSGSGSGSSGGSGRNSDELP
jgi:RNA polymerase sigma factor (sigma-70 family)